MMRSKTTTDGRTCAPVAICSDAISGATRSISHGFFTRRGGVSKGLFSSLNTGLGSGDERQIVRSNRAAAARWLGADPLRLATPFQTHSNTVVTITEPWSEQSPPRADAVVTQTPGLAIGVLTADCCPILFADPHEKIVGATHAGWKGAIGGVIENTIKAMENVGANRGRLIAAIGPTISQANYEVGPEFVERFMADDPNNNTFFVPSATERHAMFDLPAYIASRLGKAGVEIDRILTCTYADEQGFYSYRRSTHRREGDYGRQLSAILIKE